MAAVFTAFASCAALAADWPQWRGPRRDGTLAGISLPKAWPKSLKEEWKVSVGEGHSSPVVSGERIYAFSREGDAEVARALDLKTGKEAWKASYPAPYEHYADQAAVPHGKGPKATPLAGEGSLYTLGISGILTCFDIDQGSRRWQKDFSKDYPMASPRYGAAASPLLEGGLLIAQVGGHGRGALAAFDAKSGEVRFRFENEGPGYASPIVVDLAGERQIITQTQEHVAGVSARDGKLLWKLPFKTPYYQNSVTPLLYKDLLIISGVEQDTAAYRVVRTGAALEAKEAWRNRDASMYMSSPVLAGDLLFGFSHKKRGQLFCLDAGSGKTQWLGPGSAGENAALLGAADALFALTTGAKLVVFRPSAEGFEPLAEYETAPSPTWAHPVILGARVLVKDKTSLISLAFEDR